MQFSKNMNDISQLPALGVLYTPILKTPGPWGGHLVVHF